MCTITFIPSTQNNTDFILTSNRDEAVNRPTLAPRIYTEKEVEMLYPKDEVAGGTWIGASSRKRLICLMNGASKKHERKANYNVSRGTVVKDLLATEDILHGIEKYSFDEVEPFTMIIVIWKAGIEVYKLVWDAARIHFIKLENEPHIWSASMTYDQEMKEQRKKWFADFLEEHPVREIDTTTMWKFHHETGENDKDVGLIIDRGELQTTSITQFSLLGKVEKMRYESLIDKKVTEVYTNSTLK